MPDAAREAGVHKATVRHAVALLRYEGLVAPARGRRNVVQQLFSADFVPVPTGGVVAARMPTPGERAEFRLPEGCRCSWSGQPMVRQLIRPTGSTSPLARVGGQDAETTTCERVGTSDSRFGELGKAASSCSGRKSCATYEYSCAGQRLSRFEAGCAYSNGVPACLARPCEVRRGDPTASRRSCTTVLLYSMDRAARAGCLAGSANRFITGAAQSRLGLNPDRRVAG
jgi:hypothetical protein